MSEKASRRNFLRLGAVTAGALVASNATAASVCARTAPQTSGPFYPGESLFTVTNDLTRIAGRPARAAGQVIYVRGQVTNQSCEPVADANVEIWQACASGRYNNPRDPNPAPLDPNFRYWGEAYTDREGRYMFKTIVPGAYPADTDWTRPPHIHFRVSRIGHEELVTQMYFKGQSLNDRDLILGALPPSDRNGVVVEFMPSAADLEPGSLTGEFNITFRSLR